MSDRCERNIIYGVDFSGAANAGARIWVSRGIVQDNRLWIQECVPASQLEGSGINRTSALAAVRRLIKDSPDAVFGFDFPFSLPSQLLATFGISSWEALVHSFEDLFPTPDRFRLACLEAAGGIERRRETDRQSRTPFSAYNIRLYLQAYYGISSLLLPLVQEGFATALPMQSGEPGKALLLEVCPASTLRRIEIYYGPYKGSSTANRSVRRTMLTSVEKKGPLSLASEGIRDTVLANNGGDALDSIVAAFAVFKNLRDPSIDLERPAGGDVWRKEGFVFT